MALQNPGNPSGPCNCRGSSSFPFPFDDAAADAYGKIRAQLSEIGKPIGANDLLIAAIALANNLTLVTHNTSEFARVPGLALEHWES